MLLTTILTLAAAPQEAAKTRYEYRSDFVSFVGRDERGRVAFALDTNRGRDRESFQAEHFGVLYAEGTGWAELAGNGEVANTKKELAAITSSKHYEYTGAPSSGLVIAGKTNELVLTIEPFTAHTHRERKTATFDTGSAAATLTWKGRTLVGRAIWEGCYLPDTNLIADPDMDFFGDGWHGLYALVEPRADAPKATTTTPALGDLRLHLAAGDVSKLVLPQQGFLQLDGDARLAKKLEFTPSDWSQGSGFFRWPARWRATWLDREKPAKVDLALVDREVILTWVVGGFAVAIAKGELEIDGAKHEVWGLAQIIR
ncbi:MAG: hypothetical protein L6Q99_12520 [Planctomycetes bacterium]|nr:hypothetical protein [Planctomycetota bacterium]